MSRASGGLGGSGRKYHCKKYRVTSHYAARLRKREQTTVTVRMISLDDLRRIQERKETTVSTQ